MLANIALSKNQSQSLLRRYAKDHEFEATTYMIVAYEEVVHIHSWKLKITW